MSSCHRVRNAPPVLRARHCGRSGSCSMTNCTRRVLLAQDAARLVRSSMLRAYIEGLSARGNVPFTAPRRMSGGASNGRDRRCAPPVNSIAAWHDRHLGALPVSASCMRAAEWVSRRSVTVPSETQLHLAASFCPTQNASASSSTTTRPRSLSSAVCLHTSFGRLLCYAPSSSLLLGTSSAFFPRSNPSIDWSHVDQGGMPRKRAGRKFLVWLGEASSVVGETIAVCLPLSRRLVRRRRACATSSYRSATSAAHPACVALACLPSGRRGVGLQSALSWSVSLV